MRGPHSLRDPAARAAANGGASVRRGRCLLLAVGLAALVAASPDAVPQDAGDGIPTHQWPSRTFNFPVNVGKLASLERKPAALQLYYSLNRTDWQAGPKHAIDSFPDIGDGRKGFRFDAVRDGEYEFALQYSYPDGTVSPTREQLSPVQRVVIDTTPPSVRVNPVGNGVEWVATDDHLDPRSVVLECKWPASAEWTPINRAFKTADRYGWEIPPGKTLEVRVSAKDQAGNKGSSPIVRVPDVGGLGASFPKPGLPDWPPGNPDPLKAGGGGLPQPRIDYVSGKDVTIEYTIQRMGRYGIKSAHLFVQKPQTGQWELASKTDVNLTPANKEQSLALKYKADREGTYGFYVILESGAGQKADDPRRDDPPMSYVVVDESRPDVKITDVQVRPGGRGPVVEITWAAVDQNLMANPIKIEYSIDQNAKNWQPITKTPEKNNTSRTTGRVSWEVPDENLWKFWVRVQATDLAGNVGEAVTEKAVIVDLEKPAAGINRVRGGTGSPVPVPMPGSGNSPLPMLPDMPPDKMP